MLFKFWCRKRVKKEVIATTCCCSQFNEMKTAYYSQEMVLYAQFLNVGECICGKVCGEGLQYFRPETKSGLSLAKLSSVKHLVTNQYFNNI